MSDELHDYAKKMLSMSKGQGRKTSIKKAVTKADAKKATKNPVPKAKAPKTTPPAARKAAMAKPVAKAAPKAKMPSANPAEKAGKMGAVKDSTKKAAKHANLLAEHADDLGKNAFMEMERDLPKGAAKAAEKIAVHEESAAAKAAGKAAMGKLRNKMATEALEGMGRKALIGATLATPVGFGLTALMEGLDAAPMNDHEADEAQAAISRAERKRQGGRSRSDPGYTAPRGRLQNELPKDVKKPSMRREDFVRDAYDQGSPQAKMENAYAAEMKKWPR